MKKKKTLELPGVMPGNWKGEILGSCSVNFGQVVQPGPPRQSVEFSYMIMPAMLTMPEGRFTWPGIVTIFVPTPMKTECVDAGSLFKSDNLMSLALSIEVTRNQFSDMVCMIEAKRLKGFHFTLEEETEGSWPIHSWGMAATLP